MNPSRPPATPRFLRSLHCRLRLHCHACRTSRAWRESLARIGQMPEAEWDCPHGFTAERLPTTAAVQEAARLEQWRADNMPCARGCGSSKKG